MSHYFHETCSVYGRIAFFQMTLSHRLILNFSLVQRNGGMQLIVIKTVSISQDELLSHRHYKGHRYNSACPQRVKQYTYESFSGPFSSNFKISKLKLKKG